MKRIYQQHAETFPSGLVKRGWVEWTSFSRASLIVMVLLPVTGDVLRAEEGYDLWGMGGNGEGALGDGTGIGRLTPIQIDSDVVTISAGKGGHSMYIMSDGSLKGMGVNFGHIGDGTVVDRLSPVTIDSDVVSVSAGGGHTLYIKSDGTLLGMGENIDGSLGDDTTIPKLTPIVIDQDVVAIAAGHRFSLYVKSNGTLMAMGANSTGCLGDGTTVERHTPVAIDTNVVAVSAGNEHSLYLKDDGTLMGMGANGNGQLGDGTGTERRSPIVIDTDVVMVSAGAVATLYIKSNGNLWGMGSSEQGSLGPNVSKFSLVPVLIETDVKAVAAGGVHTLFLKSNGTLMSMGTNYDGQIGDGTRKARITPFSVDSNVVAVAAGGGHSLYLKGAPTPAVLEILQPPQSFTAEPGSSATFTVLTSDAEGETFEWKHGDTVVGSNSPKLTIVNVQSADAGTYYVTVTKEEDSISSRSVTLGVKAPPYTEKMLNISTRGQVLSGTKIMIAGFVLQGTGKKDVLVRGIGPTLGSFGVPGTVADPRLQLFRISDPNTPFAENEVWGWLTHDIGAISQRVGAFALGDGSNDAALYMSLDPGAFTAQVSGMDGTGVGLVELYDADLDPTASTCTMVNISTRGEVGTEAQILIAGFVIAGEVPKQVLIRGIGPRLADFHVAGTLADPYLHILKNVDSDQHWVASNDNWSDNPNAADIVTTSAAMGAFDLVDGSSDAVILTWLEPGVFTAQVSGVGETTGVALVEVYEVK